MKFSVNDLNSYLISYFYMADSFNRTLQYNSFLVTVVFYYAFVEVTRALQTSYINLHIRFCIISFSFVLMLINHRSSYLYKVCIRKQHMLVIHLKTYIGVSCLEIMTDYGKRLKKVGRHNGIKLLIFWLLYKCNLLPNWVFFRYNGVDGDFCILLFAYLNILKNVR